MTLSSFNAPILATYSEGIPLWAQNVQSISKRLRQEVGISLISDLSISKGRKLLGTLAGKQSKDLGDRDRCCWLQSDPNSWSIHRQPLDEGGVWPCSLQLLVVLQESNTAITPIMAKQMVVVRVTSLSICSSFSLTLVYACLWGLCRGRAAIPRSQNRPYGWALAKAQCIWTVL